MSPENAKDIIAKKREDIKSSFSEYSFDAIKQYLIKEKGFSKRNANWAIDLYVSDKEEILLSDKIRDLFGSPNADIEEFSLALYKESRLCAHDCLKNWFDTNVRKNLAIGLKKHGINQTITDHVLYDICGYSKQQFEDDSWDQVSLELPLWIKPNEETLAGWERGVKEAYHQFEEDFVIPLKEYLIEQLPKPIIVEDILEKSFYQEIEQQYSDIFDVKLDALKDLLTDLKNNEADLKTSISKDKAVKAIKKSNPELPAKKVEKLINEVFGE